MDIIQNLTSVNYTPGNSGVSYIVIHYTGNQNDSAMGNANYFKDVNRGASANYFVDENHVVQVVSDDDTAWAVGRNYGSNNLFGTCRNSNSTSIEMCSTNGEIATDTFNNTVELTKELMAKHGIDADHVVRHWDVCSKVCPGWDGWGANGCDSTLWDEFKAAISNNDKATESNADSDEEGEDDSMVCFYSIDHKGPMYYFDGQKAHPLSCPDEANAIDMIYSANHNGRHCPYFEWESSAPWWIRLLDGVSRA